MITSTSFKHPKIQWDIEAACWEAVERSKKSVLGFAWVEITDSKGNTLLWVRHSRKNDGRMPLSFWDKDITDITNVVLKAIRSN